MAKLKRQQLADFVKDKFNINLKVDSFQRLRTGHWQRSSGSWSWFMYYEDECGDFGSQWSLTEILQNKEKVVLDINELIVENEPQVME